MSTRFHSLFLQILFCKTVKMNSFFRSRQDSNLRSQRESDFQSDALTTRPRLLPIIKMRFVYCLQICNFYIYKLHALYPNTLLYLERNAAMSSFLIVPPPTQPLLYHHYKFNLNFPTKWFHLSKGGSLDDENTVAVPRSQLGKTNYSRVKNSKFSFLF